MSLIGVRAIADDHEITRKIEVAELPVDAEHGHDPGVRIQDPCLVVVLGVGPGEGVDVVAALERRPTGFAGPQGLLDPGRRDHRVAGECSAVVAEGPGPSSEVAQGEVELALDDAAAVVVDIEQRGRLSSEVLVDALLEEGEGVDPVGIPHGDGDEVGEVGRVVEP